MEWIWVLILAVLVLGPILLAVTKERRAGHPGHDDATEAGATIQVMKDTLESNNSFSPRG